MIQITRTTKSNFIIYGSIILTIILWLLATPLAGRIVNVNSVVTNVGRISGLVGLMLFSLTVIMTARNKLLDKIFSGLNNVYVDHHKWGTIAFILLLLHPVALSLSYALSSYHSAYLFLIGSQRLPVKYGITGLLLMMVVMVLTYYINLSYRTWKITHAFMGLAYFVVTLHILFIQSEITRFAPLKIFFFAIIILAYASLFYRVLLNRFVIKRYRFKLYQLTQLAPLIFELLLVKSNEKPFIYNAGQFVFMKINNQQISQEEHPFSIASAPSEKYVRIIIKSLGDYTQKINQLKIGDEIQIEGPYGTFSYTNFSQKQIWIAGGIGVTPFIGMAQQCVNDDYKIDLYYTAAADEFVNSNRFNQLSKLNKNFRFIHYQAKDFLTARYIQKISGDIEDYNILICGPKQMMRSLKKQFIEIGLSANAIHTEDFDL